MSSYVTKVVTFNDAFKYFDIFSILSAIHHRVHI